jgi:hypothetical protein
MRSRTFSAISVNVHKFIIREYQLYHSSGKGTAAYNEYFYKTYVDVDYTTFKGNTIHSFGKLTTHKSVEDAVAEYELLPNRPPLYYQQGAVDLNGSQSEVVSFLSQYQLKAPFRTEKLMIKYSSDKPEINSLVTIDKEPYGGILIPYGLGLLVLAFYLFFCYIGKCIEDAKLPLFVCVAIVIAFAVLIKSTYKISIDRKPTFVAGFEKQIWPKSN